MNALDHANHDGEGHRVGPAIGNKGQWHPRNGRNTHCHTYVLETLPQNHGEDSGTQQGAKTVLAQLGCSVDPPQDDTK